jgi:predicted AAA+ superfamily ATPase
MCGKHGVPLPWTKEARDEAILWSQRKGDRSGRIAYQFAVHWVGKELLRREPVAYGPTI